MKSWESIITFLPRLRTQQAIDEYSNNSSLNEAQRGILIHKIMTNEYFLNLKELADFLNVSKEVLKEEVDAALQKYHSIIKENDVEIEKIPQKRLNLNKISHSNKVTFPRPFKTPVELLKVLPQLTTEDLLKELYGNVRLELQEDGLIILRLMNLYKMNLEEIQNELNFTDFQLKLRLLKCYEHYESFIDSKAAMFPSEEVWKQYVVAETYNVKYENPLEFVDHVHELSSETILNEILNNDLLTKSEVGLGFLQIMINEKFRTQKDLATSLNVSKPYVSISLKASRMAYPALTKELEGILKGTNIPLLNEKNTNSAPYKNEDDANLEIKENPLVSNYLVGGFDVDTIIKLFVKQLKNLDIKDIEPVIEKLIKEFNATHNKKNK